MSERDELAELIRGVDGPATLGGEELAEAILAAGYRKHPKVERDDLRGTLSNTICNASNYPARAVPYLLGRDMSEVLDKTADAILAAGYRKPRTITTAEELDALAVQSVIRHSNTALHEKWASGWRRLDSWEMTTGPVTPELPATVLYEPTP